MVIKPAIISKLYIRGRKGANPPWRCAFCPLWLYTFLLPCLHIFLHFGHVQVCGQSSLFWNWSSAFIFMSCNCYSHIPPNYMMRHRCFFPYHAAVSETKGLQFCAQWRLDPCGEPQCKKCNKRPQFCVCSWNCICAHFLLNKNFDPLPVLEWC